MRIDSGRPDAHTVQINASEHTAPVPTPTEAQFWAATPDGSKVFFTTAENLINSDNSNKTDLYEYDVAPDAEGHHLHLISTPDSGLESNVLGLIGISDDGSYVYFISNEQLLTGYPTTGGDRIFVWHEGTIREVSRVAHSDSDGLLSLHGWGFSPKTARVTPDGRYLAYASVATTEAAGAVPGEPCATECHGALLYDATAEGGEGKLSCASCNGAVDASVSFLSRFGIDGTFTSSHINHVLSDDGRYIFFNTTEALVPGDTNAVSDVYEYDRDAGLVHLISSGVDTNPSFLMDAGADGRNVFFITRARLVGWDTGEEMDLYDARIDGGLPEPASQPAPCAGSLCRAASAPAPVETGSGSSVFEGPANPRPRRRHGHHKKHYRRHHRQAAAHNRGGAR
jgi:hypothetical protein